MRYAIIDNGAVVNIIELDRKNEQYFPTAVYTGDRPVGIGDSYTNGTFYRDGVAVTTALERAQDEINSLTTSLGDAVEAVYQADMEVIG